MQKSNLPGIHKSAKPSGKLNFKRGEIKKELSPQDVKLLCGNKDKYPIVFNASSPGFQLSNCSFLNRIQPNSLKEVDLSSNEIREIVLADQKKLKRILIEKNCLCSITISNLSSLQHVSLAFNDLEFIPDLTGLPKLVFLDLRGNRIKDGFMNLSKATNLRVLDLQKNNIDLPFSQLFACVLKPLKDLSKLQYLSLEANPVEINMKNFRFLIVHEFTKLDYYNYQKITKEERTKAAQLSAANAFQVEKQNSGFSKIVISTKIEGEQEDNLHKLLKSDTLNSGNEIDNPNFSALDGLLDSLEGPDFSKDNDENNDIDLNSLLDDLGDSMPNIPNSLNEDSGNEELNLDEEDPLDDILNYLDDSTNDVKENNDFQLDELELEELTGIEDNNNNNKSLATMGVASTQSMINLPVAIEDEEDYFELLGDMINPNNSVIEEDISLSSSGTEILSMLDDLICENDSIDNNQEDETNYYQDISQNRLAASKRHTFADGGARDSLEDMLSELSREESATDAIDSILTPKDDEKEEEDPDSELMDLLSEMMDDSSQTTTTNFKKEETIINSSITEDFDPLDELTNSLLSWEKEDNNNIIVEDEKRINIENDIQKQLEIKEQNELEKEKEKQIQLENQRKEFEDKQIKQEREREEIEKRVKEEAEKRRKEEELRKQQEKLRLEQEEARKRREEEAKREREELIAREEALRLQQQEEDRRRIKLEEEKAAARLKQLEEEEKRLEEELKERERREEERRKEEERIRIEEEQKKQRTIEEQKRKQEEERKRREEEEKLRLELEKKREEAERKEKELRAKVEAKKQLLLKQQKEEEERKRKETEEMMRLLEEEQKREEEKRLKEEEEERLQMEQKGYVDELVNQIDYDDDNLDGGLSSISSSELTELRNIRFTYAIPFENVQIFELLGGGTFGSCYRGIYNNKEVIIKKLNCNLIQDNQFMDKFKNEVSKICVVNNPHLINVQGASVLNTITLVTDYIQGTPLFGILRNRGIVLDISEKIRFAQQIAIGIGHLHNQGIIYSGLKTKNILINSNNDVILRDFGLLCIKDFVRCNGSIGSPQYTAPELILAPKENYIHNFAEDIYSFGIVLWEIFSGHSPYKGMMSRQVCTAVTQDMLRPEEPLDCPIVIWKVIQSCWNDNPESRPDFDKLIRILHQPLANIMKYGLTTGSTEHVPRGAPINDTLAHNIKKNDTSIPNTALDAKVHMVIKQVKQMIVSGNPDLQSKALKVMINIGKTESNIEPIISSGMMKILHKLLTLNDWRLREGSARALGILCEWPECEKVARDEGIILALVQNLSHESEIVIIQSAKTLITLTKEKESQKSVRACGGLVPFLKMMDADNELLVLQSVWAFSHLLEDDQFQQDFYESGGVRKLLMLLGSSNPGIQFRVLVALGNLISNPKTYPIIEKAAVFKRFLMLLDSKSPILRLQAAKATERMSSKGALRQEITKNGGMSTLIKLLNPDNESELIMAGLNCLINFATDKKQILSFKQAGGLPAVLQVLESKNNIIQYQGIRFFSAFVDKDELNKEISRAIGFIPRCVGLLTSSHPGIQKTASDCLVELSTSSKCIETILSGGGLPPLIALIDNPSIEVKQNAIYILSVLISNDASVKEKLISTGSIKKLMGLLRSPDLKIKEACCLVLCPLCETVQFQNVIMSLNGLPSFVTIIRSTGDEKVQTAILTAFNHFIKNTQYHSLMIQTGCAESIISFLNNTNTIIQTSAIRCMLLLCVNAQNKESIISYQAIPQLQQVSNSSSPSLKAAAQKCLSFLS